MGIVPGDFAQSRRALPMFMRQTQGLPGHTLSLQTGRGTAGIRPAANRRGTIAAEEQFVLMAAQKSSGELGVPAQAMIAGIGGKIAEKGSICSC